MKHLEVCGAILMKDGKVLCAQRNAGKYDYVAFKWEFPGGKLEEGETPKEALHRELIEEMEVHIDADDMEPFYVVEHVYPDFEMRMHCFICSMGDENPVLREHADARWCTADDILDLDWAPADLPVVRALVERGF
ncbi:MAG: (deoxy)nucleoside triphosphate pyrophosphohydrolase [Emergencia sp.]